MRKIIAGLLLTILCATASGQVPPPAVPTYAMLSLIGDRLEIVIGQLQTGSHIDKNRREPPVEVRDPVFDNVAATSAGEAIRKIVPRAELAILNSRSPVLFAKQQDLFEVTNGVMAIPEAIRTALANEKATHLVLISKHRGEAQFHFANINDGAGLLEGLGFYLDGASETRRGGTGEGGRGFIAPFVYAKVLLVDAQSSKVIRRENIMATMPISSARALEDRASPWAALTSAEKVNAINRIIQREMVRVVPLLLKAN